MASLLFTSPLPAWLLAITTTITTTTNTTTTTTTAPISPVLTGQVFADNQSSPLWSMPKQDPVKEKVIISLAIVRLTLAVCGLLLNTVAAVVLTNTKLWSPTSMLLLSLVVYDALYLLLMIPVCAASISVNLHFTHSRYSTLRTIMAVCFPLRNMAQMASTYTTVAVTVERYLVILLPLRANSMWTYGKTRRAIIGVLLFSVLFNLPRCFDHMLSRVSSGKGESGETEASAPLTSSMATPFSVSSLSSSSSSSGWMQDLKDVSMAGNTSVWFHKAPKIIPAEFIMSYSENNVTGNESSLGMRSNGLKMAARYNTMYLNGSGGPKSLMSSDLENEKMNLLGSIKDGLHYLYQVVYLFYLTVIFLYLIPYTLIPILNLQLVLALRRRRKEKYRLSIKKEYRLHGTGYGHCHAGKEEGLTYIVFGITFSYFVCCILPAVYMVSAIASDRSRHTTSIYILNAAETTLVVNAATDFFFYCLLGRKFRHVFFKLFCPHHYFKNTATALASRSHPTYSAV